jgi:hypothetical protein
LFGVLSVFGRCIKGMIRLRPEQVWTCNVTLHVHTCSGRKRGHESRPHCHDTVLTIRGNVTSVYPPLLCPFYLVCERDGFVTGH